MYAQRQDHAMDGSTYGSRYPPEPPGFYNSQNTRYAAGRTPSPTPSEVEALTEGFGWMKKMFTWRFWARKDWISMSYLFRLPLDLVSGIMTDPAFAFSLCRMVYHRRCSSHSYNFDFRVRQTNRELVNTCWQMGARVCQITCFHHASLIAFHSLKFGWLIPVAILFIISFPPVRHVRQVVIFTVLIIL